jgi:hypothetical protein
MTKSNSLLSLLKEQTSYSKPAGFSSTINGFSLIVSDSEGDEVDRKIISMVETDTIEGAINDLQDVIRYLQQHKDKFVDLSEPII